MVAIGIPFGSARVAAAIGLDDWAGPARSGARTAYNGHANVGPAQVKGATRKWRIAGGTFRAPLVAGSTVVAVDQGVAGRSRLEAFDLATGTRRWTKDYGSSPATTVGPPTTDGVRVHVIVERRSGAFWLYDLYAVDLGTGSTRWTAPLGASKVRVSLQPAYSANGAVYAPWVAANGVTHIAKYTAGAGAWQWSAVASSARTYAVAYGSVWIALPSAVLRIDADTGQFIQNLNAPDATSLAVAANQVIVADGTRVAVIDTKSNFTTMQASTDPGCRATIRTVTLAWIVATQSCPTARPILLDRATRRQFRLVALVPGDIPTASTYSVGIGANAARSIDAFDVRTGAAVAGFATSGPVSLAFGTGPVVGRSRIVVPEVGWLEVYA